MLTAVRFFSYMQFHPFAYMVKLRIEMSMADLIVRVARGDQYGHIRIGEAERTPWRPTHSRSGTGLTSRVHSERSCSDVERRTRMR